MSNKQKTRQTKMLAVFFSLMCGRCRHVCLKRLDNFQTLLQVCKRNLHFCKWEKVYHKYHMVMQTGEQSDERVEMRWKYRKKN